MGKARCTVECKLWDNYTLVVEPGNDVIVEDAKQGKHASIFFQSLSSDEELQKRLREAARR